MIVKQPACYDLSHYINKIQDFKLIDPKPVFVITKATEADPSTTIHHTDGKFVDFFSRAMDINAIRGAYHFHRNYANPYKQADHFLKTISQMDILLTDFLILDVEEGKEKASSLWVWFTTVRKAFPNNRVMLYSAKYILDAIVMTPSEKEFFKGIPIWTAGYPTFPDLYSKTPSGYVPDQTKYGKVGLWQYSGGGIVTGIDGEVDLNLIEPAFYSTLGDNSPKEVNMATFTTECIDSQNKFWASIGGANTNQSVKAGTDVTGDAEQTVAGVKYLHITSPIAGWTKALWFGQLTYTTTPPPPPPPPPPTTVTKTHDIEVYSDGSIKIDGNPYP